MLPSGCTAIAVQVVCVPCGRCKEHCVHDIALEDANFRKVYPTCFGDDYDDCDHFSKQSFYIDYISEQFFW